MKLEGSRVRLRRYRRDDLPRLCGFLEDTRLRDSAATSRISLPTTLEEQEKWYVAQGADPRSSFTFAIERKDDNLFIGECGWTNIDWKNCIAETGMLIGPEFQGQGYGTDAKRILVEFLFGEMPIHKITSSILASNQASIRMNERLGFRVEAVLREHVFREGRFQDLVLLGLLRQDFVGMAIRPSSQEVS